MLSLVKVCKCAIEQSTVSHSGLYLVRIGHGRSCWVCVCHERSQWVIADQDRV